MREMPVIISIRTPTILRVFVDFSSPYRRFAARYLKASFQRIYISEFIKLTTNMTTKQLIQHMIVLDCPYHRIVNIPNLTLNYLQYGVAQKRKKKQYTDKPEACRSNADFYQFVFPNKICDYQTSQKLPHCSQ